jgi:hypothetical protein
VKIILQCDIVCAVFGLIQVFDRRLNHKIASLSIQSEGGGILTSHFEYMIRVIIFCTTST